MRVRPVQLNTAVALLFVVGSACFVLYVLPTTGELINSWWSITGTLLGAVCFLVGAALIRPAWTQAIRTPGPVPT